MSTTAKLAGFLAAALAVFGLALVVGRAVGPVGDEVSTHDSHGDRLRISPATEGGADGGTEVPGGLMTSQDGYRLTLTEDRAEAGRGVPVSFTITGPDGEPVTSYDVEHEKQLHLIAVRRDLSGFQHVHPTLDEAGVWSTDLDLTPGTWRVFADFKASGADALTLGTDLAVAGNHQPVPPAEESRTATVGDYEVTLDGELAAGADARLTLSVTKGGKPVTDLEPYLGAYGHLVALRAGDLAYLHVHPDGTPGDGSTEPGPDVVFHTAVPSAGDYQLFLDFQHDGVVRTAAFAVTADGEPSGDEAGDEAGDEGSDDHEGGHQDDSSGEGDHGGDDSKDGEDSGHDH